MVIEYLPGILVGKENWAPPGCAFALQGIAGTCHGWPALSPHASLYYTRRRPSAEHSFHHQERRTAPSAPPVFVLSSVSSFLSQDLLFVQIITINFLCWLFPLGNKNRILFSHRRQENPVLIIPLDFGNPAILSFLRTRWLSVLRLLGVWLYRSSSFNFRFME